MVNVVTVAVLLREVELYISMATTSHSPGWMAVCPPFCIRTCSDQPAISWDYILAVIGQKISAIV